MEYNSAERKTLKEVNIVFPQEDARVLFFFNLFNFSMENPVMTYFLVNSKPDLDQNHKL